MFGDKNKEIFIKTLKIGESLLRLSFTDYNDAYSFSEQHCSESSKHFIEHFSYHSDEPKGTYEKDVIRYNYIKAIEHRISSDLYANTSRGNVCDVFQSPYDVHLPSYPTNLPRHLEIIVNGFQGDASRLADEVVSAILPLNKGELSYQILNAIQFLGQAFGYHVGQDNREYKGYLCGEMLTRDEINIVAGRNLCNWLERNGYEFQGSSFTREPCLCILAVQNTQKILVGFSAEIAPVDPGFIKEDLDELYAAAQRFEATPYYACVNIGSADETHFKDGVILAHDQMKFVVRAFDVLEVE